MLLKLYLEQLSPSILSKILDEHKINMPSMGPNEVVEYLDKWLLNYDNLDEIYNGMTREEKEVLSYFILQIPNEALAQRRLHSLKGKISRDEFGEGINKLKRKGIIYFLVKEWGNTYFVIPENLFLVWHKYFTYKVIIKQNEEANLDSVKFYEPYDLLEEDLYRFLVFLQFNSKFVTKDKKIPKKHLDKIASQLKMDSSIISNFPTSNDINLRSMKVNDLKSIDLLFTIADTLELLDLSKGLIVSERITKWHNLNSIERKGFLEQVICACFRSSDLFIQHIFYLLFNLPKNKWFSFTQIVEDLSIELNRPIAQEILIRAENEIMNSLSNFGWIQRYNDNKHDVFRWVDNEKEEINNFYVQPNYEILVPYTFPHNLRIKIERISRLEKYDYINKYVITKETIMRSLETGLSKEDIITFLGSYSVNPINTNIIKTISDWSDNYGLISFLDVRIMKCSTELIANEIKKQKALKKWIIGEIDSCNLIIRKSNYDDLIRELNTQGIYPRKEIWSESLTYYDSQTDNTLGESEGINIIRFKGFNIENTF